jgi:hypothetical protein
LAKSWFVPQIRIGGFRSWNPEIHLLDTNITAILTAIGQVATLFDVTCLAAFYLLNKASLNHVNSPPCAMKVTYMRGCDKGFQESFGEELEDWLDKNKVYTNPIGDVRTFDEAVVV